MKRLLLGTVVVALSVGSYVTARQEPQTPPKPVPPSGSRDVALGGPPTPAGTGAIAGTLVAADSGRPVRRARVTVSGGDTRINKSVNTDDRGNFSFTSLPTGDFLLSATKGGYLDAVYGQLKPGTGQAGTPIHLLAAQRIERLAFPILRGGVITGTVIDEFGDPAFGTPVRAMRYSWRTGERRLTIAGTGTTDDRGIYRIPALPPGEYVVSAVPRDGADQVALVERMRVEEMAANAKATGSMAAMEDAKMAMSRMLAANDAPEPTSGYAPVYYPNTTQFPSATTFTLGPSEERGGIDVQLQLVPLVTLTGSVTSSQQTAPAMVQLIDRSQAVGQNTRSTRAGSDGTFTFQGVAPGQYTVVARAGASGGGGGGVVSVDLTRGELAAAVDKLAAAKAAADATLAQQGIGPGAQQLWAVQEVSVDGRNKPSVFLSLQPGMTVSGSVRFDGGPAVAPAQLARMSVMLSPAGSATGDLATTSTGTIDAEGRFVVRGVMPGTYSAMVSGGVPPQYTIKSAMFAGREALDFLLEIKPGEDQSGGVLTFGTGTSEIAGSLQNPNGAPAPGYTILVFSADSRYWLPQSRRIQSTRPSTTGRFSLRNLPAGDYRIVPVTDVEPGQWYDPALLRQLTGAAIPITLMDGERKTQDLRIR